MAVYYSASKGGFYHDGVQRVIPEDAVEITKEEWRALLGQQSTGKRIVADPQGRPIAVDYVRTPDEQADHLLSQRVQLLAETDWLVSRHRDELEAGGPTTLTPEVFLDLQRWRAALRALPQTAGFPHIELPARPAGL
jgi:hypothetical protein